MTPNQYRQGGPNVTITYATLETPLGLMICPSTFEPRPSRFEFGITSSPFRTVKFSPKPKWRPGSGNPNAARAAPPACALTDEQEEPLNLARAIGIC